VLLYCFFAFRDKKYTFQVLNVIFFNCMITFVYKRTKQFLCREIIMKKKLLAILMVTVLSVSMLTACGSKDDSSSESSKSAASEESTDESSDAVSDEYFAKLQEAYAALTDEYNQVVDIYNSDEIAANADIEDTLAQAKDVMEQMGEIDQSNLSQADAETLMDVMVDLEEALNLLIQGMEVAEDPNATASAEEIQTLQDNYALLVQAYDLVVDAYNDDSVAQSDDIEAALAEVMSVTEQMGELETDSLTSQDCSDLNGAIVDLANTLQIILDNM